MSSNNLTIQVLEKVVLELPTMKYLCGHVFPVVDLDGQLVASLWFSSNESSTTIRMVLIDGSDETDITISDELLAHCKTALEDSCYMLVHSLGLSVDKIRLLLRT